MVADDKNHLQQMQQQQQQQWQEPAPILVQQLDCGSNCSNTAVSGSSTNSNNSNGDNIAKKHSDVNSELMQTSSTDRNPLQTWASTEKRVQDLNKKISEATKQAVLQPVKLETMMDVSSSHPAADPVGPAHNISTGKSDETFFKFWGSSMSVKVVDKRGKDTSSSSGAKDINGTRETSLPELHSANSTPNTKSTKDNKETTKINAHQADYSSKSRPAQSQAKPTLTSAPQPPLLTYGSKMVDSAVVSGQQKNEVNMKIVDSICNASKNPTTLPTATITTTNTARAKPTLASITPAATTTNTTSAASTLTTTTTTNNNQINDDAKTSQQSRWSENYKNMKLDGIIFIDHDGTIVNFVVVKSPMKEVGDPVYRTKVHLDKFGRPILAPAQTFDQMIQAKRRQQMLLYPISSTSRAVSPSELIANTSHDTGSFIMHQDTARTVTTSRIYTGRRRPVRRKKVPTKPDTSKATVPVTSRRRNNSRRTARGTSRRRLTANARNAAAASVNSRRSKLLSVAKSKDDSKIPEIITVNNNSTINVNTTAATITTTTTSSSSISLTSSATDATTKTTVSDNHHDLLKSNAQVRTSS